MDCSKKSLTTIRNIIRNLRSLHHLNDNAVVEDSEDLKLFTRIAFMHSASTRSLWRSYFRKAFKKTFHLQFYLKFFVRTCNKIYEQVAKTDTSLCLLSMMALTANLEVHVYNRGFDYLDYSEGIIDSFLKRDLLKTFRDDSGLEKLRIHIRDGQYPETMHGAIIKNYRIAKEFVTKRVVSESGYRQYCDKMDSLIVTSIFDN